jgi:signal transduction histidine kinase
VNAESREHRVMSALVRFGELLSGAVERKVILEAIARAAVEDAGAAAAVVVEIGDDGEARIGATANLPIAIAGFPPEDALDPELGAVLLAACSTHDVCRGAQTLVAPLVSGGGLFGSVVFVFPGDRELAQFDRSVAFALASLGASGLNCAARYADLARNYEELRASRDALAGDQKLRALGEMAAGVSHDLKNIINPLSLHLQFLKRAIPKTDGESQQSIVEMQGVLKRGLETIERLRDFSRQRQTDVAEVCDLSTLAREALDITRPRMRVKHDAHYKLIESFGDVPPVKLVASEAVAAIVNLIVNAIDAMPTGGTIEIATGTNNDGEASLRVADDGPGMTPEVRAKVFEPFFTTKGKVGTGLGLSTVFSFVQRSHGRVALETEPGKGAAFALTFPPAS